MAGKKTAGALLTQAWGLFKANYKTLFLTALIIYGSTYLINTLSDQALALLGRYIGGNSPVISLTRFAVLTITFAIMINCNAVALVILAGGTPSIKKVANQFETNAPRYIGITVWSELWITLWSLLFIIPGIVKGLSYMLAPYLVIEYPEMTVRQCLRKSMAITKGHKGRLFTAVIVTYVPAIMVVVASFILSMQHITQYQLYLSLFSFIINLFLVEPFSCMLIGLAYLDSKKMAVRNNLLPKSPSLYPVYPRSAAEKNLLSR